MAEDITEGACPFCGESDFLLMDEDDIHWVMCLTCRTCGPTASTPEKAHEYWIERYEEDAGFLARRLVSLAN